MDTVYLDNNATTAVAPQVVRAVAPALGECYGNPSSGHVMGQRASQLVERARQQVADLIGAKASQIIFTSGGTESDNLAIRGAAAAHPNRRRIVTTSVEHLAVLETCQHLAGQGYDVVYVGVDSAGRLDLDALADAVTDDTAVVSVMWANNETGVIFPVEQVARLTASRNVPLHVDAVQAVGKLPIDLARVPIDLMTLSGHKMHGLKGAGALVVRKPGLVRPMCFGGHHEQGLRAGTHNVVGIVALGAAAELAGAAMDQWPCVAAMRDRLEEGVCRRVSLATVNGDRDSRLPNTTNIAFESLEAEAILLSLSERGLCASAGSACTSGSLEPSHVLQAMGLDRRVSHGAIRFSLSRDTTDDDIDRALKIIPQVIDRLAKIMAV